MAIHIKKIDKNILAFFLNIGLNIIQVDSIIKKEVNAYVLVIVEK